MDIIEIVMVVVGIIAIIVSCFLIDQTKEETVMTGEGIDLSSFSKEQQAKYTSKVKTVLEEIGEDTISKTEEHLSKISNEKIIAVNDFSEQLFAKMKHNHEEVIFLYNMLCEKEAELRMFVKETSDVEMKSNTLSYEAGWDQEIKGKQETKINQGIQGIDLGQLEAVEYRDDLMDQIDINHNDQILKLHAEGKSVGEIARLLGIGQGEIRLVIQLFSKLGGK